MGSFITSLYWIKKFHGEQKDKAGVPYWQHPYRVAMHYAEMFPNFSEDELIYCLWHDILEDTDVEPDFVKQIIGENGLIVVQLLTKEKKDENGNRSQTYLEWIESIAYSDVPYYLKRTAIRVKMADIKDNGDPVRIAQLPYDDRKIIHRYSRAFEILSRALSEIDQEHDLYKL